MFRVAIGLLVMAFCTNAQAMQEVAGLDLRSIPIADWIENGENTEIPWRLDVRNPVLRMDQRMEVAYSAVISGKQLRQSGTEHELFFVNRISDPDGEWLTPFAVARQFYEKELPNSAQVRFNMRAMVKPGEYVLWVVLYDRKTGHHNVARRRIQVREIGN